MLKTLLCYCRSEGSLLCIIGLHIRLICKSVGREVVREERRKGVRMEGGKEGWKREVREERGSGDVKGG